VRASAGADSAASAALALNPTDVEALVAAGALHTGRYEFEEAEALFLRALEVSPGSALVFNWYGDLLQFWDRGREAVEMEGRAAELDPLQPVNHYNLAQAYRIMGELDSAVVEFRRALELAPEHRNSRVELMTALFQQEAWTGLDDVARSAPDPEDRVVHVRAAAVLKALGEGRHDSVQRDLTDWRPSTPLEFVWGGMLLRMGGRLDEWVSYQDDDAWIMPFGGQFISTDADTLEAYPAYGAFMRSPPRDKLLRARWERGGASLR